MKNCCFHIDEKNNQLILPIKALHMITKAGEDPEFFVLPDIGVRLAEIEKTDSNPEEKLHQKEALLE